jgi:DNA polymerase-3 subunit delta
MAAPKADTLLADAIKTGKFEPVYCLHGENEFRKDEALRQIINSASDPATRDFNVDVLRAGETDAETLEAALGTLPMLAERRVVVLRDPSALKKQARTTLDRYLGNPSPDTVLVLVVPADEAVPKGVEEHARVVELQPITDERLIKWIIRHARTAHDVEIQHDAADLLQRAVGPDLLELTGELDKLASYATSGVIDTAAVSAVVGARPGETMGDLLDAVAARDVKRALALVAPVLRQPKGTGVMAIMTLTVHVVGIGWCRARRDAGVSTGALERAAFALARRVPPFLSHHPAGARASAWARASGNWPLADVDAALEAFLAADIALKETRVASDEQIVSTAILAACAGAERSATAA